MGRRTVVFTVAAWLVLCGAVSAQGTIGTIGTQKLPLTRADGTACQNSDLVTWNTSLLRYVCAAAASSGAPDSVGYWTDAPSASLSAERSLGGFTGLVLNTAGVPTSKAANTCTNQFARSDTASGVWTCATVADADLAGSITPSKITGTAAILGANTFTAGQIILGAEAGSATLSLKADEGDDANDELLLTVLDAGGGYKLANNSEDWVTTFTTNKRTDSSTTGVISYVLSGMRLHVNGEVSVGSSAPLQVKGFVRVEDQLLIHDPLANADAIGFDYVSATKVLNVVAEGSGTTTLGAGAFKTTTALVTTTDGAGTAAFTANMSRSTGGPTADAQNGWLKMQDSTGATVWVPVWK